MSARSGITKAIAERIALELNGTGNYLNNIFGNVSNESKHFDNIQDFPYISVTPGPEQREYLPSNFTWATLTVYIRVYVHTPEDPQAHLETLISDLETFVDKFQKIPYNVNIPSGVESRNTVDSSIMSIATDEGLLSPYGAGEIALNIRYEKLRQA